MRGWFVRLGNDALEGRRCVSGRDAPGQSAVILKGGTAFNLCFGSPKQLSVDLDSNLQL